MGDIIYTSKQRKTFHRMFITVVTVKVGCLTSGSYEVTAKCRDKIHILRERNHSSLRIV